MKKSIYSSSTLLMLFIALSFIISSCKKKEDDPTPTPAPAKVEGKWGLTAMTGSSEGITIDFFASGLMEECEKNSTLEFKTGGVLVATDACDGNTVQNGTWTYNNSTKILNISNLTESETFTVTQLTANTMKHEYKAEITGDDGVKRMVTTVLTYTRK